MERAVVVVAAVSGVGAALELEAKCKSTAFGAKAEQHDVLVVTCSTAIAKTYWEASDNLMLLPSWLLVARRVETGDGLRVVLLPAAICAKRKFGDPASPNESSAT